MIPGTLLDSRYEVIRTIGSGGMGDVYQARRVADAAVVAVKVLREEFTKDQSSVVRFHREARATAALKSRHAARIYDVGDRGQPFIVMEYLEGRDLSAEIEERGFLPPGEAVAYVVQACHAMIEAHDLGIVHRDLKPSNLFLAREGDRRVVKVLDFGISKITNLTDGHVTQTQMSFGSPLYMSPEQIRSAKLVDHRSDVWSLGVILYEALTGDPPFIAETAGALAVMISIDPHVPPSQVRQGIPPGLDDIIAGTLQKNPRERYSSVRELLRALEDFLPAGEIGTNPTLRADASASLARSAPGPLHADPLASTIQSAPLSAAEGLESRGSMPFARPPGITLGPATSDRAPKPAPKSRTGVVLAALFVPLGIGAFAFAVWLYAQKTPDRDASRTVTDSAAATSPATERAKAPASAEDVRVEPAASSAPTALGTDATISASSTTSARAASSASTSVSATPTTTSRPKTPKNPGTKKGRPDTYLPPTP
ncbi:MAG: protein kinase [Polyangiaceae bacterium]|nr:protein kinase [Polyangiaceae bacterium]